jgi:APA family basic amino acid/polyamine antiporter
MEENKPLGFWTATSLVTGNMIGSGLFLLPAVLAGFGGISILGWIFSTAGALLLALVFAGLAQQVKASGGPYIYTRAGLGDALGFVVAWGYWISIIAGNAAIAIALVGYMSFFYPQLASNHLLASATAISLIWSLAFLNMWGIRQAGQVQLISTMLKVLPIIAVAIFGVWQVEISHFEPWNRTGESTFSAITATAAITVWAFLGLECANIPAAEVQDATRTVPRAAIVGTLIAACVYVPSTVVVMGLIDAETLSVSSAPFADAATILWGDWGGSLIAAGAIIACFGALNGWTLCMGQIPMAAAKDKLFPESFGIESRRGTPVMAISISTVLVTLLVMFNYNENLVKQFTFVILLSTLMALLPYFLCALARLTIAIKTSTPLTLLDVMVSLLGAVFALWMIMGTGAETVYWGLMAILAGLIVYVWILWRSSIYQPLDGKQVSAISSRALQDPVD